MAFSWTGLGIFIFYGVLIGLLAYAGYWTTSFLVKGASEIGAVLGGIIGVVLSVYLWLYFGKAMVEKSNGY